MAPQFRKILRCYIDETLAPGKDQPQPVFDRKLVTEALQFRIANQLMTRIEIKNEVIRDDFYLNITVWRLERKDGGVEYLKAANDSNWSQAQKILNKRVDKAIAAIAKANRGDLIVKIEEELEEFYVYSGVHSEVKVAQKITQRMDVRDGSARVTQVYTERKPCFRCRAFLKQEVPALNPVPFYYFIPEDQADKKFALQQFGKKKYWKNYQLLLLDRYGV